MRSRNLLAMLSVCALLSGSMSVQSQQENADAPKIELLDAGSGPKQLLRMHPSKGDKQTMVMTMATKQSMTMNDQPMPSMNLPTMRFAMTTEVTGVEPSGDIACGVEYTECDVEGNDPTAQQMRQGIQAVVGIKGTMLITNRGVMKSARFEGAEDIDPAMEQIVIQMEKSANQMSVPLPEEAVGVGARWKVSQFLDLGVMKVSQTSTFEVVALDVDGATLRLKVEQSALEQMMNSPSLPPDATMTLKSMKTSGDGETKIQFNQLVPVVSNLKTSGTVKMNMQMQGQSMDMDQQVDSTIQIKSTKRS